jgi:hypothetical protein
MHICYSFNLFPDLALIFGDRFEGSFFQKKYGHHDHQTSAQLFSFMEIFKEQILFKSISHTGRGTGQHTVQGISHEALKKFA